MASFIIVSILAALLGTLISTGAQSDANKKVMDFNAEEAEKNRQWQEEQYKKYESPAAQMQQRQQAGLTPFENISSMSVGSGATASSSANASMPYDFSLFSQMPGMIQQAKQTKLQNKLLEKQIEGEALNNETKTLENIKLAVEANDYASYYSLVKESMTKGNALTDAQILESFEKARAQTLDNDMASKYVDEGGNVYTDEHNESVARVAKIMNDIKNDNIRVKNETALNNLQMSLMKSKGEFDLKILKNDAQYSENISQINKLFDVDYYALPDYLKVASQSLLGICYDYSKGKLSSEYVHEAIELFKSEVDVWQNNATNSSTPGYLTDWEKDKQKSEFMVEYGNLLLKIASGGLLITK